MTKNHTKTIFLNTLAIAFAGMMLLSVTSYGQDRPADSVRKSWWLSVGFGPTTVGALSGGGSVSFEGNNHWLYTANALSETSGLFGGDNGLNTYNLLLGKICKTKIGFFTASAGLGLADVYDDVDQATGLFTYNVVTASSRYAVNVPIMVQAYLVAFQSIGLGIGGYVNLNTIRSSAGFNIAIAFGRITTHRKHH